MRRLRFLALFSWAVLLLGLSLWRFPVPLRDGLSLLRSAAVCALLLTAALAHGRAVLARFKLYHGSLLEEAGFAMSLGLLVLSLLGSALGALGVLYDWVVLGVLTLAFIIHWEHLESLVDTLARSLRSKHAFEGSSSEVATVMALALAGFAVAALCLAPPTFYDALVYHLADAQRTALMGRAVPQPEVLFSWLPSLPGPIWALALTLDGDPLQSVQAAALLNLAAYALLGLMVLDAGARLLSERRVWLAPALALTQPLVALSFGVFSPDGWMALYAFLSLNAFLLGLVERTLRVQGNWLWLSALLAGAAVAAKPTALAHAGALLILLTALVVQEPGQRRVRVLLGGLGLFLVPLLPWLLRGLLAKGQPFYPFPADFFGWSLGEGGPAAYFRHVQGYGDRDWLRLPYNLFFDPAVLGGGGHLSFLLLILVPAALAWRLSRELRWCGFYLGAGLACWLAGPPCAALRPLPGPGGQPAGGPRCPRGRERDPLTGLDLCLARPGHRRVGPGGLADPDHRGERLRPPARGPGPGVPGPLSGTPGGAPAPGRRLDPLARGLGTQQSPGPGRRPGRLAARPGCGCQRF